MINTEFCDYQESMLLKELGYNEPCGFLFEDGVTHNGKYLTFEDELDLKAQGRAKEIKRIHGDCVTECYNTNYSDFMGKHSCSRPTLSQALRWLREVKDVHIEAYPSRDGSWHVWIVYYKSHNPEDDKLDACDMEGQEMPTYEEALHHAFLFQLTCMKNAKKHIEKLLKQK